MLILDGKALAGQLRQEMAAEVQAAVEAGSRPPGLAVILAGSDPASQVYVRNKQKACAEVGITSIPYLLPETATMNELLALITALNADDSVDGILLQLPLPRGLNARVCVDAIDPAKDVDGFHPLNVGRLALDIPGFLPCTPAGVMEILRHYGLSPAGRRAVVVGRSDIVGKPLAMLLSRRDANATVTLCHSGTEGLKDICRDADFLFLALGRPGFITADMVKDGSVVVDIGITRTPDGLRGDADFASLAHKTRAITPVPGGVGPMTIAMLLKNTLKAWKLRSGAGEGDCSEKREDA